VEGSNLVDLGTYAGIALAVVGLVGAAKKLFKAWVDGKEPMLALCLTLVIGVTAKIGGMFGVNDVKSWLLHVIVLVLTATASGNAHDFLVNKVLKNKD
jgi:hypothetical protein